MAYNYINAGSPEQYQYHMPMQLIQQMEFTALQIPSCTDLSNLMNTNNISHCSPIDQQMTPVDADLGSSNTSAKAVIGDFLSIRRPASSLCMPYMTEALSVHGVKGNCSQPFQYFSGQTRTSNLEHSLSINKGSSNSGVLYDDNHQINKRTSEALHCLSKPQKTKCKKEEKNIDKEKKYKRVRFVKPGCSNDCQRRCKQKLSQNTREDLFNEFWNLSDDCSRRELISKHAIKMPMMTCKEGSRRSFSVDWAFTVRGESFSVCKLFFLDTLDISEEMAYSVIKETTFCSNDICATKRRRTRLKKSVWFETDVDDYSERKVTECSKPRTRFESKKEKITEMRPGCTDSCRRNCQSKFTLEDKLSIFNGYRCLSNVRKQREFILKHVRRLERKCVKSNKVTRRGCSIEWLLPVKGESIPVCKTFFLHTVGISEHTAYSIGLQNGIQPIEKHLEPKKVQHSSWSFRRNIYLNELIAKGRLKTTLKVNKKKCKKCDTLNVNDDNESKAGRLGYLCEKDGLKSLSLDNNQPCLIISSDRAVMLDAHLQHTEFSHQCFGGTNDVGGQNNISSAGMKINLTSSTSGQHIQIRFGSTTNPGHLFQQSAQTQNEPSHMHDIQTSPGFLATGEHQTNHDNLLLQTLKNTTGSLFPFCLAKNKRRQSSKEKLSKTKLKRETEIKPFTKKLKDGCSETCRRKCSQSIPQSARVELFENFWQLECDTGRREFILPIVNKAPKKSNKNVDSRRGCTIEWTVPYKGELHFVCKKFFLDTFDITENFVKTIHDKIERNEGSMEDMRGKHGKRSEVFLQEEREIEKHIKSIANYRAVRCIRCNRDFPRWCLEKKIPLSQLYKEYAEVRKLLGVKPACRTSFMTMCAKKFSISHNAPSENICDECVVPSQATHTRISSSAAFS